MAAIVLKDANNNIYDVTIEVDVTDDAPENVIVYGPADPLLAGGLFTGSWSAELGADVPEGSGLSVRALRVATF